MKRKNYYQVHKNKRPKKVIYRYYVILKMLKKALLFRQTVIQRFQSIPKYKLGSSKQNIEFAIVGEANRPEPIDGKYSGELQHFKDIGNFNEIREIDFTNNILNKDIERDLIERDLNNKKYGFE